MRILIIDDEEDIRQIASLSLTRLGNMEVTEAASAAEGLRQAEEAQPDGILLDVRMPSMDGAAALAALRANPRTAGIPVIFLTASTNPDEVAQLKKLGAASVLSKPFDPMTLPQQVRGALGGR